MHDRPLDNGEINKRKENQFSEYHLLFPGWSGIKVDTFSHSCDLMRFDGKEDKKKDEKQDTVGYLLHAVSLFSSPAQWYGKLVGH